MVVQESILYHQTYLDKRVCSFHVIGLGTVFGQLDTVDLLLDTCIASWHLVFFGWSALLVMRLVLGGR